LMFSWFHDQGDRVVTDWLSLRNVLFPARKNTKKGSAILLSTTDSDNITPQRYFTNRECWSILEVKDTLERPLEEATVLCKGPWKSPRNQTKQFNAFAR